MEIQELRQLTVKKLWAKLREIRRILAVTKFHVKTGREQDSSKIGKIKRMIAQILTILHNEKK